MERAGLALALLVAVYAALLFGPLFFKAADQFERHVSARTQNIETAARNSGGGVKAGGGSFNHKSYLVLLQGSGGHL